MLARLRQWFSGEELKEETGISLPHAVERKDLGYEYAFLKYDGADLVQHYQRKFDDLEVLLSEDMSRIEREFLQFEQDLLRHRLDDVRKRYLMKLALEAVIPRAQWSFYDDVNDWSDFERRGFLEAGYGYAYGCDTLDKLNLKRAELDQSLGLLDMRSLYGRRTATVLAKRSEAEYFDFVDGIRRYCEMFVLPAFQTVFSSKITDVSVCSLREIGDSCWLLEISLFDQGYRFRNRRYTVIYNESLGAIIGMKVNEGGRLKSLPVVTMQHPFRNLYLVSDIVNAYGYLVSLDATSTSFQTIASLASLEKISIGGHISDYVSGSFTSDGEYVVIKNKLVEPGANNQALLPVKYLVMSQKIPENEIVKSIFTPMRKVLFSHPIEPLEVSACFLPEDQCGKRFITDCIIKVDDSKVCQTRWEFSLFDLLGFSDCFRFSLLRFRDTLSGFSNEGGGVTFVGSFDIYHEEGDLVFCCFRLDLKLRANGMYSIVKRALNVKKKGLKYEKLTKEDYTRYMKNCPPFM